MSQVRLPLLLSQICGQRSENVQKYYHFTWLIHLLIKLFTNRFINQRTEKYRELTASERWQQAVDRNKLESSIKKGWFKRNELMLMFGFTFMSVHVIWWNMQRNHVPMEERTEIRVYRALCKKWEAYNAAKWIRLYQKIIIIVHP